MPVTPNSIITPQAVQTQTAVCATANSTYSDTPTNTAKVATAGPNGGRLTRLYAIPRATVTATQLQAFRSADGGTTKRFFASKLMAAYTMAQTTECAATDFGFSEDNPLILDPAEEVHVAIGVSLAGGVVFVAEWADY